jgi:hypothetical protein
MDPLWLMQRELDRERKNPHPEGRFKSFMIAMKQPDVKRRNGIDYVRLDDGTKDWVRIPPNVEFTEEDVMRHSGSINSDPTIQVQVAALIGADITATQEALIERALAAITQGHDPDEQDRFRHLRKVFLPPSLHITWVYWKEWPILVWTPPRTTKVGELYVAEWEAKILVGLVPNGK